MNDRIVVTYRIETPGSVEKLAAKIASDQSTGTFVPLPGETPELKARVWQQRLSRCARWNRLPNRPSGATTTIWLRRFPSTGARPTSPFRLRRWARTSPP